MRQLARAQGWLDAATPLPADAALAEILDQAQPATVSRSCVEPYRALVAQWAAHDVRSSVIYAALKRRHQFTGSYASVHRFVRTLTPRLPKVSRVIQNSPYMVRPGFARVNLTWQKESCSHISDLLMVASECHRP